MMKDKKAIKILNSISPEEMSIFRKFLQTKFHTSDEAALRLFNFIHKYHLSLPLSLRPHKYFSLEKAFKKVYPKEEFCQRKIEHKCSDLSKLAEEFLILQELKNQPYEREKLLSLAFQSRNNYELEQKRRKSLKIALDKQTSRDETYYIEKVKLLLAEYFSGGKFNFKQSEPVFKELLKTMDSLIRILQLQVGIEAKSRAGIFQTTYPLAPKPNLQKQASDTPTDQQSAIQLYELAYRLVEKNEKVIYIKLKQCFFEMAKKLGQNSRNTLSSILLNFAFRNLDKQLTRKEALELAKEVIQRDFLRKNGYLPSDYFVNISILSSELKDTNWTQFS